MPKVEKSLVFSLLPLTLAISAHVSAEVINDKLPEAAYQMNQIVVTASNTEQEVDKAAGSVTVISGDELREKSGGNIVDALRKTVGINVTNRGVGGRQGIGIRGLDSNYTVIMVDGRRINAAETLIRANDLDVATIPVDSIERIEVVRGPMSSLYGADALGGVINIITKSANDQWAGSLSYDFHSIEEGKGGDEHKTTLNLSGPVVKDKLNLKLSADFRDRDFWRPFDDNPATSIDESGISALEKKKVQNLRGILGWKIDEQQSVDFELAKNEDKRHSDYNLGDNAKGTLGLAVQDIDRETLALTHKGLWVWGDTQLRAFVETSKVYDNIKHPKVAAMVPGTTTQTNKTLDGFTTVAMGNHQLTTGAEYTNTELDNPRDLAGSGKSTVIQKALYAQDEWFLTDDWTATLGGRLDHHSGFGSHFSPRGYLVYSPANALTVKGGVGTAYKAPTIAQTDPNFSIISCRGKCLLHGNPNLKPEKSINYELSAHYTPENWSASATFYRNEIEDMIDRKSGKYPDGKTWVEWINVNEASIQGVELTGSRVLTDTLSLTANYSYTDAKDTKNDIRLQNIPRDTFNTQLDWQALEDLNTFISLKYIGSQEAYNGEIPSYTLVDTGVSYVVNPQLSVRTGITNLGNTRMDKKMDDFSSSRNQLERGRTFYVGATASF